MGQLLDGVEPARDRAMNWCENLNGAIQLNERMEEYR